MEVEFLFEQYHIKSPIFQELSNLSPKILHEVYFFLNKAKEEGWDFNKFKTDIVAFGLFSQMQDSNWKNDESGLKVIYETFMNIIYMRGKYRQMMILASNGIYTNWQYLPSTSHHPNPLHKHFYNKIFRFDDPIWKIIFPPSCPNCKCSVRAINDSELLENNYIVLDGNLFITNLLNDYPDLKTDYEYIKNEGLKVIDIWKS